MIIGAGFLYGLGVFSGLVLAGLAFLIYLTLKPETDPELDEATARAQGIADRLNVGVGKVHEASTTITTIEPGE